MKERRFRMYDYGSPEANAAAYGGAGEPPDIAALYPLLAGNLVVDLVAGVGDGVVAPQDVERHYDVLAAAGVAVSLKNI
jgi:hypothetical protein